MRSKPLPPPRQQLIRIQLPAPQPAGQHHQHATAQHLPQLIIAPPPVLRNKLSQQRRAMRRRKLLVQALCVAISMLEKIPSGNPEKDHGQAQRDSGNPLAHALALLGQKSSTAPPPQIQQKMRRSRNPHETGQAAQCCQPLLVALPFSFRTRLFWLSQLTTMCNPLRLSHCCSVIG